MAARAARAEGRSAPSIHFARDGQRATMDAARRIAALTHGDRAAWEGTALFHELLPGSHWKGAIRSTYSPMS